jgi:endosialidase-like protein
MDRRDEDVDAALQGIDEARRATLRRMIMKGAFVAPIVASFAMAGLTVDAVAQCGPNTTCTASGIATPSDRRLKTDMVRIATHDLGFGIYRFRYLWSADEYVGVLAQEVDAVLPSAVVHHPDGFLAVDYAALGMAMRPLSAREAAPLL